MLIPGVIQPGDYNVIYHIALAENAMVAGDVVQWSDTASSTYPLGVAVEDSAAGIARIAGVIAEDIAIGRYGLCQVYGYTTNITTDGSVAASDTYLIAGTGVAVGATETEMNVFITDATVGFNDIQTVIGWNVSVDVGTVGQCFITTIGR